MSALFCGMYAHPRPTFPHIGHNLCHVHVVSLYGSFSVPGTAIHSFVLDSMKVHHQNRYSSTQAYKSGVSVPLSEVLADMGHVCIKGVVCVCECACMWVKWVCGWMFVVGVCICVCACSTLILYSSLTEKQQETTR